MPILTVMVRRKPTRETRERGNVYAKPQLSIKPAKIIRGNMQKCLLCHGIMRIKFGSSEKPTGFYLANKKYPHKVNCPNKDKF